jgi:16S rRNA (cytidine1402-2'-O)-methyltransferase
MMADKAGQDPAPDSGSSAPADLAVALYVVATPLGNLRDITLRALDVLGAVDLVAAEDTRTTTALFNALGIRATLFAAHDHNEDSAARRIVETLAAGRAVALVTDAGTPAISDPGARVVRAVLEAGHRVIPLPGPSAITCALSAAGFEGAFRFEGFLPPKPSARRTRLTALKAETATLVLYEAPHRIVELAVDMAAVLEATRRVVIGRELTKRFETVHATTVAALPAWLAEDGNRQRGEFVVIIEGAGEIAHDTLEADRVLGLLLSELPVKSAARLACAITGGAKNALYARALELKGQPRD